MSNEQMAEVRRQFVGELIHREMNAPRIFATARRCNAWCKKANEAMQAHMGIEPIMRYARRSTRA